MKHAMRTATAFAFASMCLCAGADAKIVTFQIPFSYPSGINDKGEVTGFYDDHTGGGEHGFLWQPGGAITTFDVANAESFRPEGISTTGVVTGSYALMDGSLGGFSRAADGTVTTYNVGWFAIPAGMNSKGWVVGAFNGSQTFLRDPFGEITKIPLGPLASPKVLNRSRTIAGVKYLDQGNQAQGFIRPKNGTTTLFGDIHRSVTVGGMNDAGDVVGWYADDGQPAVGFFRTSDGTITTFVPPNGGTLVWLAGINNSGTVAGSFLDSSGVTHGFLRAADGTFTPFDPKGSVFTRIQAINNKGAIAGSYWTQDDQFFDFAGKP